MSAIRNRIERHISAEWRAEHDPNAPARRGSRDVGFTLELLRRVVADCDAAGLDPYSTEFSMTPASGAGGTAEIVLRHITQPIADEIPEATE